MLSNSLYAYALLRDADQISLLFLSFVGHCTWRYTHRGARAWAAMTRQCCICVSTRLNNARSLRVCAGLVVNVVLVLRDSTTAAFNIPLAGG
jgi:hypothetical protein